MLRVSLFVIFASGVAACGTPKGGTLRVDTPALPYKAPDIEELSGVSDDEVEPTPPPAPEPPKPEPKAEVTPPAPPATPAKPATPPAPAKPGTGAAPAKK